MYQFLVKNRELIIELTKNELKERHTGQVLGALWAFGQPLFMISMYVILFTYVFPNRYTYSGHLENFSVCVLAGIVPWLILQDILNRSSTILITHSKLVKQVAFPIAVLPLKVALASFLSYLPIFVVMIFFAIVSGYLNILMILLPLLLALLLLIMIGFAYFLSAFGVFFRDLKDIISVFCSVNLFLQPILYNPSSVPSKLQFIFYCNPFSYLIWCWQDIIFWGHPVHLIAWFVLPSSVVFLLFVGIRFFNLTKRYFGEII
ncbi:hypothetical protein CUN60_00025 [Aquella oligotrophica]|uniref:Transport permease protein n=1 Tax=Aquella oligotrophica TaxID=2067065 RepID=A0A2I7N2R8_9NEIS|nr:hypothetical protein CUN60_00025 [Aquella oligotrophica]